MRLDLAHQYLWLKWLRYFAAALAICSTPVMAQVDKGVRGGAAGAGNPVSGLDKVMADMFATAKGLFQEVDDTALGLGPRFNLDSCAGCHSQPAIGGTFPAGKSP